jgi:hypothetical protein
VEDDHPPSPGIERRLAVALVSSILLSIVGRAAILVWGNWLAIPTLFGFIGIATVLTVLEARARKQTVAQVLKYVRRNWRWFR